MGGLGLWVCLAAGVGATGVALLRRWLYVRRLGPTWWVRFALTQGLAVNAVMALTFEAVAGHLGWKASPHATWALPLGYGLGFLALAINNADWTVRKFHAPEG